MTEFKFGQWYPIESVPDGQNVLLFQKDKEPAIGKKISEEAEHWDQVSRTRKELRIEKSHWWDTSSQEIYDPSGMYELDCTGDSVQALLNEAEARDNIVAFPGVCLESEVDVERINLYDSYNLGGALAALGALASKFEDDGVHPASAMYPMWQARTQMLRLLNQSPVPLGVSKASAEALLRAIIDIFREHLPEGAWPDQNSPLIPSWKLTMLRGAIEKFETVFGEEVAGLATYCVPRKGIFDTPALIDTAEESFPKDIRQHVPQKSIEDWRAAGRCLAFNLLSASGFHVARAVEGTLELYYQLYTNKPGVTLNGMYDYIKELGKLQPPSQVPEKKTLDELIQLKDDYRNPLMHPRVVLSESDAKMLFNNGESLIIAMAQEIAKIRAAQLGAALVSVPTLLSSAKAT